MLDKIEFYVDNSNMENFYRRVYDSMTALTGKVGVAVSGGADSMCLLSLLMSYPDRRFKIIVINVEHGIRGEESIADSEFVKEFATQHGLEFIGISVNAPEYALSNKVSLESAARILRYEFFEDLLSNGMVDHIALAHHADDICETVLMRIFRGTGLEGLKGIQSRDRFIRPLLKVTRNEIEEYIAKNSIPFKQDSTNNDSDYTRNFLRNEILPMVETRWSDYRNAIIRLTERAKENDEFLKRIAPSFHKDGDNVYLYIDQLKEVDKVLQKMAIRQAVIAISGGIDFEEINLNDVLKLLDSINGSRVDLANGLRAWKEYDKIVFELEKDVDTTPIPFKIGEFMFAGEHWAIVKRTDEKIRFDISKIPSDAIIRVRQNGDNFVRFNGISSSLGDFYTDKKVPKRLRDRYPIIAVGNDVLVTPFEISSSVKLADQETEQSYTLKHIDNK